MAKYGDMMSKRKRKLESEGDFLKELSRALGTEHHEDDYDVDNNKLQLIVALIVIIIGLCLFTDLYIRFVEWIDPILRGVFL